MIAPPRHQRRDDGVFLLTFFDRGVFGFDRFTLSSRATASLNSNGIGGMTFLRAMIQASRNCRLMK